MTASGPPSRARAMSMATGEYVSVHSQADTEAAALAQERAELEVDFAGERRELTDIYVRRGLDAALAAKVAAQLMAHDALGSHARDELGLSAGTRARPLQAAFASAGSFAAGAALPVLVAVFSPPRYLMLSIVVVSLLCLLVLGGCAHGRHARGLLERARHGGHHHRRRCRRRSGLSRDARRRRVPR